MATASSPVPTLAGGLGDFFTGLSLPWRSLSILFRSRKVCFLSLLSSLLTAAALIAIWIAAWKISAGWFGEGALREVAHFLATLLMWIPLSLIVPSLVLAPLQDPISEATEEHCGNFTAPPFSIARTVKSAAFSIAHTASRLFIFATGYIVLLPLHIVPGIGSVTYAVLSTTWGCWWLCAEYVSGPMARHLMPFRAVRAALRRRSMATLGFGLALYLMLFVPVLNFFLVPLAVVGGTLLFRALRIEGLPTP